MATTSVLKQQRHQPKLDPESEPELDSKPKTQVSKTTTKPPPKPSPSPSPISPSTTPKIQKSLHRISLHPTLTPYRRRVYRVLLSVPPGRWTTYSALAKYLNSSARAVGNAMRTNPFAPDVPCHRVLAADGSLGGYKGVWEKEKESKEWKCKSRTRDEKIQLLVDEGVVFDDGGERARATGRVFGEFVDWGGK